jgi:small subunit ribosomal protein S13
MPRLAGVDIPNEKRIDISLTYIFGIGDHVAKNILKQAKVDGSIRAKNLTAEELRTIQGIIETLPTEGELRKVIRENIETLKRSQAYRGIRHMMGLPVRGQRTRTNARTRKGKKKTIGALSKEAAAKLEPAKAVAKPAAAKAPTKK